MKEFKLNISRDKFSRKKVKVAKVLPNKFIPIFFRYLHYALDETKIRSQDTSYVFSYVANYNPIGRNIAWNFLKENWDDIYNK